MIRKGVAQRMVATALAAIAGIAWLGFGGLFGSALIAPSAEAATVANCANGVIVAVDLAGLVRVVCDTPLPKSAADALVDGKFDPTGVTAYPGLSFICTIDGYPRNADCATTPTGAYWSFWYAEAGQNQWTYSPRGAEALEPTPGSVEGWFFGTDTGATPPTGPNGLSSPNTIRSEFRPTSATSTMPPTTTTTISPTTTVPITRLTPVTPTTRPPKKKPSKKRPTTTTLARPKTVPHPHRAPNETAKVVDPKNTTPKIVHGAPAVASRSQAGSPIAAVVGGAIVLGIGVTALVLGRRRRQTEEE
jgi:hypothetical protein